MQAEDFRAIVESCVESCGRQAGDGSVRNGVLIVSRTPPGDVPAAVLPPDTPCHWCSDLQSVDDLPADLRMGLGIVFDQLEFLDKPAAVHLLSRLRDQHCERVAVCLSKPILTEREMLALGYMEQKRPSIDGRLFLFDPDMFFTRREWNTPNHWANPENFSKYRW